MDNENYQAYLLRLWREGGQAQWRASLQSTRNEHVNQFATLEALIAFLNELAVPVEIEELNSLSSRQTAKSAKE